MHPEHARLLARLQPLGGTGAPGHHDSAAYIGSDHALLGVSVPALRRLAKAWAVESRPLGPSGVLAVLDSLIAAPSHEEKTLAALILGYDARVRQHVAPARVDRWLDRLVGWAEVDALCHNVFTAEDMLADWAAWEALLLRLAVHSNINKRRAALVLLNGPVRYADDPRFAHAAFRTLDVLKSERAILITKAASWLLRSLVARHGGDVGDYIEANRTVLPAIAIRETRSKLETGRKR